MERTDSRVDKFVSTLSDVDLVSDRLEYKDNIFNSLEFARSEATKLFCMIIVKISPHRRWSKDGILIVVKTCLKRFRENASKCKRNWVFMAQGLVYEYFKFMNNKCVRDFGIKMEDYWCSVLFYTLKELETTFEKHGAIISLNQCYLDIFLRLEMANFMVNSMGTEKECQEIVDIIKFMINCLTLSYDDLGRLLDLIHVCYGAVHEGLLSKIFTTVRSFQFPIPNHSLDTNISVKIEPGEIDPNAESRMLELEFADPDPDPCHKRKQSLNEKAKSYQSRCDSRTKRFLSESGPESVQFQEEFRPEKTNRDRKRIYLAEVCNRPFILKTTHVGYVVQTIHSSMDVWMVRFCDVCLHKHDFRMMCVLKAEPVRRRMKTEGPKSNFSVKRMKTEDSNFKSNFSAKRIKTEVSESKSVLENNNVHCESKVPNPMNKKPTFVRNLFGKESPLKQKFQIENRTHLTHVTALNDIVRIKEEPIETDYMTQCSC